LHNAHRGGDIKQTRSKQESCAYQIGAAAQGEYSWECERERECRQVGTGMSAPEACCTLAAPEEDCEDSSGSETEPAPAFHRTLSTKEASKGAVVSALLFTRVGVVCVYFVFAAFVFWG
jgi:hypothetical protein